jgi:perosamine synthetase
MENRKVIPYHKPYPLDWADRYDILKEISNVLQTGQLTNGENVRKLEDQIQEIYKTDYVICTSSCTQALLISLKFLEKSIIQVPAFNWWSDLYVLDFLKKINAWVDIDEKTWLPKEISKYYAALYLHTFGNIGMSNSEDVIYDASHCFGAKFKEIGLATCISLAPTKLITSCEGGVILTNNEKLAAFAIERRDKMCRLSEPHAIIGLQTLKYLEEVKEWKKRVYDYYKRRIPGQFQVIPYDSSYNTIGFLNTENLKIPEHLIYKQYYEPLYDGLKNTKKVYDTIVCLPSYFDCPYEQIVEDILEVNGK